MQVTKKNVDDLRLDKMFSLLILGDVSKEKACSASETGFWIGYKEKINSGQSTKLPFSL
jgi:hypothetical protein